MERLVDGKDGGWRLGLKGEDLIRSRDVSKIRHLSFKGPVFRDVGPKRGRLVKVGKNFLPFNFSHPSSGPHKFVSGEIEEEGMMASRRRLSIVSQ